MAEDIPVSPPKEAIAYFRDKGIAFGFAWQDVWQAEHAVAFTVAKAMSRDVLETIRAAVDNAIADGETLDTFRKELRPRLEALGWWGRKPVLDPLTGARKTVQLGSPRRLKTIFAVNMRTAYQAGRWERIVKQKAAFPYLRYTSVLDGRERPQHHAWHGTVKPVDDAWWDSHYPPCGWNCRCTATAFSRRMLEKRGYSVTDAPPAFEQRPWTNKRTGEVTTVEDGIDPGWSYNVGKARMDALAPSPLPKGFEGRDGAAAAAIGAGAIGAGLAAFFGAFGIGATDARSGRMIEDKGGWPLAVSLAWFMADGSLAPIARAPAAELARVAAAIADPHEIRWAWVNALDGSKMLFRRYVRLNAEGAVDAIVDVGRDGWRYRVAGDADLSRLRRGAIAWSAEADAAAGYNPYQPRNPKGAPGGGRFRQSTAGSLITSVVGGKVNVGMARTGNASADAIRRIEAHGIAVRSPAVWLSAGGVRHILKRHGADDRPVTVRDIKSAHLLLNRAKTIVPGANRNGPPRIRAAIGSDNRPTIAIFEVRRRGLVLLSMHKRGPRKKKSPA